ncbi:LPS O-antigen length regulator [Vibrio sp. V27_P1S3P104]|uniref:Wzz/FepE/Etk N-terminal domain-containing protein n=1 Tax=unclassified Vibrio TaxID=2614977 RepID=UPI00137321E9|nr:MULTISPECIES: Wzz/FepE/Etk N-terminal domain-containing protein [unclassified Vibrio]NAW68165.1 LPS O-antigen length regulator [Vibrio sp. V28_P6S34P95]NAX03970.1 LPS O-antigen length regulator [Vibrio sp. V30_P3S12P165]NAX35201.1 LPS O-antigen length regulator [Vibrio sp. V29_P1S30P107]NAX37955.1 LPS O-antigen length regulator [Vibrio sp. V27_P1S3P104]NAX41172.1 LPS O-antigen length regulator [Vibrio sp. V26_P1S5P106]
MNTQITQNNPPYQPDAQFAPLARHDDEIDLRELFIALWKGKWIIIATTFIFAVGAVFYALSQPNIYKSDILLASAQTSSGNSLAKMAGQLGGLAALAGVNLGSGEGSQTELAAQVIKSRQFIQHFIEKYHILVPLMATKGWDLTTNQLIINDAVYDEQTQTWLREPQGLRGAKPTAQEAHGMFVKNILTVTSDKTSGLYTVSVSHYSPYIAQQWATWLVAEINQVMRERTIAETTQNLNYLQEQLQKTSVADMQATFYKLIEEQTKSLMLAEVQDEFVFKVVDPAVVPELKDKPKRALICVLGTLLGGMLGVAMVLVRFAFRKEDTEDLGPRT